MSPRLRYALLFIVSFGILCLCVLLANNFYWGASPTDERGEYYLFKRTLPQALGQLLWLGLKPLLLVSIVATFYFLYRYVRSVAPPKIGFCPRCGYDIRATPYRCPECGANIAEQAAR